MRVRAAAWFAALVWLALTAALAPAMADAWRVRDGFDLNARAGSGTGHAVIKLHLEKTGVEIGELIGYGDARLPELSEANFGYRQVPQHLSRGSIFALGRPVAILSETEELIPRTPTHVVISKADIIETPGDPLSVIETFAPGVTVHVVEQADAWVRIAVNGARIGWGETARLAVLQ